MYVKESDQCSCTFLSEILPRFVCQTLRKWFVRISLGTSLAWLGTAGTSVYLGSDSDPSSAVVGASRDDTTGDTPQRVPYIAQG